MSSTGASITFLVVAALALSVSISIDKSRAQRESIAATQPAVTQTSQQHAKGFVFSYPVDNSGDYETKLNKLLHDGAVIEHITQSTASNQGTTIVTVIYKYPE